MSDFDRINSLIKYDPLTGEFHWKINKGKMREGKIAGGLNGDGYWMIGIDCKRYYGHRIAWLLMMGEWPYCKIDHIDTDQKNNRWENIREANTSENAMNTPIKSSNTSGYKGVSWAAHAKKWQAHIMIDGRSIYLGIFQNPVDAHNAYASASNKHHKEFGRTS